MSMFSKVDYMQDTDRDLSVSTQSLESQRLKEKKLAQVSLVIVFGE